VERVWQTIAEIGHSPAILAKLSDFDAQMNAVDREIDEHKAVDLTATVAEMR